MEETTSIIYEERLSDEMALMKIKEAISEIP
jgi:hypothetical protein